jgi:hypothetical protein
MEYKSFDYDFYEYEEHVEYIQIHQKIEKEVTKDISLPKIKNKLEMSEPKADKLIGVETSTETNKKVKIDARFSTPVVAINKLQMFNNGSGLIPAKKPIVIDSLSIYTVTWNLFGKTASSADIKALLPEKKYDMYVIGSEECMRSIFKSFFYSDKSHWEKMIM